MLRVRGKNAKRARLACDIRAECGEFGMWEVPTGVETETLNRSPEEAGYV